MFDKRWSVRARARLTWALLAATGFPLAAHGQVPQDTRGRLEYLQQQERSILDLRNWWAAMARNPDMLLLPNVAPAIWMTQRTLLNPVPRALAWEMAQRQAGAWVAMRQAGTTTPQQIMDDAEQRSRGVKESIERGLLPAYERDLQRVRDEFQQLMARRERPEDSPRTGPAGRAWYFRRAVVGTDRPVPGFELLDSDATESGGFLQFRGKVTNMNCEETWEARWKFGGQISRMQQGMQVPITLEVQLTSRPCPSALGTFIGLGGSTEERVIMAEAPSTVYHAGAIGESGPRAEANGTQAYSTTSGLLTVGGNPGQSNAWTFFRLQIYMPGQAWVVGYIYLAGGG